MLVGQWERKWAVNPSKRHRSRMWDWSLFQWVTSGFIFNLNDLQPQRMTTMKQWICVDCHNSSWRRWEMDFTTCWPYLSFPLTQSFNGPHTRFQSECFLFTSSVSYRRLARRCLSFSLKERSDIKFFTFFSNLNKPSRPSTGELLTFNWGS